MEDRQVRTIERRRAELEGSTVVKSLLLGLEDLNLIRIRCLALGKLDWLNTEYQLALLLILADALQIRPQNITCYDPIFDDEDKRLLARYGYEVTSEHPPNDGTLWFVPHGPVPLVIELAPLMTVYVGNDLSSFEPRVPLTPEEDGKLDKLRRAQTSPIKVNKRDKYFTALNDMAIYKRLSN